MILIEGGDLMGKTTLADSLLMGLDRHVYAHFSKPPPRFNHRVDYVDRASKWIVQDRFHVSDIAYRTLDGALQAMDNEVFSIVDTQLKDKYGMLTVLLYASDDSLIDTRWRTGELYTKKMVKRVNKIYQAIRYDWDFRVDVCTADMDLVCQNILEAEYARI